MNPKKNEYSTLTDSFKRVAEFRLLHDWTVAEFGEGNLPRNRLVRTTRFPTDAGPRSVSDRANHGHMAATQLFGSASYRRAQNYSPQTPLVFRWLGFRSASSCDCSRGVPGERPGSRGRGSQSDALRKLPRLPRDDSGLRYQDEAGAIAGIVVESRHICRSACLRGICSTPGVSPPHAGIRNIITSPRHSIPNPCDASFRAVQSNK